MPSTKSYPIYDLHCDLPSYLARYKHADPLDGEAIGCAVPHLRQGNVQLQVMVLFTPDIPDSAAFGLQQARAYRKLLTDHPAHFQALFDSAGQADLTPSATVKAVAAIESANGFCNSADSLAEAFRKLEAISALTGPLLYISLTHSYENRFGGPSGSKVGLKADGEELLEYLDGRKTAIDLSHASDAQGRDILNYIDRRALDIPVIASHSNYRPVWDHPRNLPEDLADAIITRRGLIGVNFLRRFLHDENSAAIRDHLQYALARGGEDAVAFGADYFYEPEVPDPDYQPLYWPEHRNASRYPAIVQALRAAFSEAQLEKLCYRNAANFIQRIWGE